MAPTDGWFSLIEGIARAPTAQLLDEQQLVSLPAVYEAFDRGVTLLQTKLQRRWPAITRLCNALERDLMRTGLRLRAQIGANAYLTPAGAQGFAPHYDDHCVLILQLQGTKQWRVYRSLELLPTATCTESPPRRKLGAPVLEMVLSPGDVLYVPRGAYHEARALDTQSLHLTLGLYARTWADVLAELARRDATLRRSLPRRRSGAAASRELAAALRRADLATVFDALDRRTHEAQRVPPGRGLANQGHIAKINPRTRITLHPELEIRIETSLDAVVLSCGQTVISGPRALASVFRWIDATRRFRPADLPNARIAYDRIDLVRQLVRAGLAVTADPRRRAQRQRLPTRT